jgi:hypothetical protein
MYRRKIIVGFAFVLACGMLSAQSFPPPVGPER